MNSWHLLKGIVLRFNMHRSSITYASTLVIMQTLTPRSRIVSVVVLIPSSRSVLTLFAPNSFNELVNMAITQDDCIIVHRAEKKRKAPTGPSSAEPLRYRLVQNTVPKATQRNPSSGRWVFRPPQQQGAARPPMPQQQQSRPRPNFQQPNRGNGNNRCFTCGSPAHFARNCPRN